MDEQRKDQIEDWTQDLSGATLESLMSLVPGVGPFLAVFANRMMGSAFERRTKRVISELRDDLVRLEQSGQAQFTPDLAESDEFQAAMHRTIRRLLESGSQDKRKLLRNAMLNRVTGFENADQFERALDACDADDVLVLLAIDEGCGPAKDGRRRQIMASYHIPQVFQGWQQTPPGMLATRVALLVSLGLVDEHTKSELENRNSPSSITRVDRALGKGQPVKITVRINITEHGDQFLKYLTDPLDPDEPEP
ncbi:hypothetical protein KK101_02355 [Curtobacterium flaccumfaciens pv. oortii]|uniref:hypothetical protein n=1 Tax=Curtobacterium flaccumfaciens TaxID=2035 RepID=UPI001BDEC38E|nr:hypothetical protein [Curtobacterium flaccumfaciens]MBT1621524.1 hypothetical protein [Curtobacterium flaccumfaciens pv. oortii]